MGRKEGESWQCCSGALLSVCAVMTPSLVGQRLHSQPQQLPWECVRGKDRAEGSDAEQTCQRCPASKPDPTTWPLQNLFIRRRVVLVHWCLNQVSTFLTSRSLCLASETSSSWKTAGRKDWAVWRLSFPVREKELCSQDLLLSVHLCPNYTFL